MAPSEAGYLFMLLIGVLSLAATVAVIVFAHSHRHERESDEPRAWQRQFAGHEPDWSPRDRVEERLHRQHAAGDHGDGTLIRGSHRVPRRAGV